jgi:fibronectin-binding autotransporter adhesin
MPANTILITATGIFTVPENWDNTNNSITVIGAGGGGSRKGNGAGGGGSGGGGGAYGLSNNVTLTPGTTLFVNVGIRGLGATTAGGSGGAGGNTWINFSSNSVPSTTTDGLFVRGGGGGSGNTGGLGGSNTETIATDVLFGGGGGGAGNGTATRRAGAGGGSAGSFLRIGGNGGTVVDSTSGGGGGGGGTGGNGNNSTGSTGAAGGLNYSQSARQTTAGGIGSNGGGGAGGSGASSFLSNGFPGGGGGAGTEYSITAGGTAGSGGAGAGGGASSQSATGGAGGAGGLYGAGGGGGGNSSTSGNGGNGANGAIIITFNDLDDGSRYWVGGSGTWDNTSNTNWSLTSGGPGGASPPTSAKNAVFDANSDSGGLFTVTISTGATCLNFIVSDVDQTLTLAGSTDLTILGNITLPASNFSIGTYSGAFTMTATTSRTITSNGSTVGNITFNGAAGTFTLQDALTSSDTVTLSQGTLAIAAQTLTANIFSSSGTSTRSITRSTGNIIITGNDATIVTTTGSGATYPSGLIFTCSYSGSTGTRTFNMNSGPNTSVSITAGSDTVTFTASDSIGALNFTGFTGTWNNVELTLNGSLTVSSGMTVGSGPGTVTFPVTATITTNGQLLDFPVTINLAGITITLADALTLDATRTFTLTAGTLALGTNTLTCGLFTSSGTSTRAVTRSTGNITITGNDATVLTLTGSGATYPSGLEFSLTYSGSTGTRTINSLVSGVDINVTAGTDIITFTASNSVGAVDFTGFAGTWSNVAMTIRGLIVSSGMTVGSGANTVTFAGTVSVTTNGKTLDFPVTYATAAGTLTFNDSFTIGSTRTFTHRNGTLSFSNLTLTVGILSSGGTNNTRALTFGTTGKIVITGDGATVLSIPSASALTYTGTNRVEFTYSGPTGTRTLDYSSATNGPEFNFYILSGSDTIDFVNGTNVAVLDFQGFQGTVNLTGTLGLTTSLIVPNTVVSFGGGGTILPFGGTGVTFTTNGVQLDVSVNQQTNFTLVDALTLGSTRTFTLTNSTLTLNDNTLTTGLFNSSNSNTRALAFGTTGKIVITGNNGNVLITGTLTNFTYTGTGRVDFAYAGSTGTRTFTHGGSAGATSTNVLNLYFIAGSDIVRAGISSIATNCKSIDFTGFSGTFSPFTGSTFNSYGNVTYSSTMTTESSTGILSFLASATITSNGVTINFPVTNTAGTLTVADAFICSSTFTLTAGTLDFTNLTFTTLTFSSNNTNTRSIAFGSTGKIVLTGNTFNMATITNFTWTGTQVLECAAINELSRGISFGNTAGGSESNSWDVTVLGGNDSTFTLINSHFKDFTFNSEYTGRNSCGAFFYGNLTFSPNGFADSGTVQCTFTKSSGTQTLTTNGIAINRPVTKTDNGVLILNSDFTTPNTFTLTAGTFNANVHNVSTGNIFTSGTTTRTLNVGSQTITLTSSGTSFNAAVSTNFTTEGTGSIRMSGAAAMTFSGGGASYPRIIQGSSAILTFTGSNTFRDITNDIQPTNVRFTAATTTTFTDDFNLRGTPGNFVTITSPTTANHTLSKASGIVATDYLNIRRSTATGGAEWYANTTSIDSGNNSGWIFTDYIVLSTSNGNFILLFV